MKARDIVAQLLAPAIVPMTRQAGFRKAAFTFRRQSPSLIQLIMVQLSSSTIGSRGQFFINVGYYWPSVAALEGQPILDQPPEYACHYRRRLEQVLASTPAIWQFDTPEQAHDLLPLLEDRWRQLIAYLDETATTEAFMQRDILQDGAERGLYAQLAYIAGDRAGAIRALQEERAFFQNRPNWNPQERLRHHGLQALAPFLEQDTSAS